LKRGTPLKKDVVCNLNKDRYGYCVSVMLILKEAIEPYRDLCIETFNLDILKCVTIASFSMKNFRTEFMKEENLVVLAQTEYEFITRVIGGRAHAANCITRGTHNKSKRVFVVAKFTFKVSTR
jgi:hypothetical protein